MCSCPFSDIYHVLTKKVNINTIVDEIFILHYIFTNFVVYLGGNWLGYELIEPYARLMGNPTIMRAGIFYMLA